MEMQTIHRGLLLFKREQVVLARYPFQVRKAPVSTWTKSDRG
jgi:hypothetical protein